MKFLIGLILGGAISVGVMSMPEPRHQLIEHVSLIVERAKQLSQNSKAIPSAAKEIPEPIDSDEIEQVPGDPLPQETNDLAISVTEEDDVPFTTLGTSLFQVAWSPFRSEMSARGFAATLKHQLSQEFQVIKTGPGRYEVGFLFDSEPERSDVLKAINEITGFESTTPPRIVEI